MTNEPKQNGIDNFSTLEARKYKFNQEFVFTPEHIEKFLWIDQEIKKHLNRLRIEGEKLVEDLEKMTKDENSFFNDYEIEAIVTPIMSPYIDENQSLSELEQQSLSELEQGEGVLYEIDHYHFKHKNDKLTFDPRRSERSLYFDEFYSDEDKKKGTNNWNIMVYEWRDLIKENPALAEHHIGYGMRQLCNNCLWSLQDIMLINDFWCDIKVEYQRFCKIKN